MVERVSAPRTVAGLCDALKRRRGFPFWGCQSELCVTFNVVEKCTAHSGSWAHNMLKKWK